MLSSKVKGLSYDRIFVPTSDRDYKIKTAKSTSQIT